MTGARKGYTRRFMRRVSFLLGMTLLSVACGEGFLRLCPASVLPEELQQWLNAEPHDFGISHPSIGALEQPYRAGVFTGRDFKAVYHTDGYGFRNPWPWPTEADLVVIGDAVAFGYGVEDTQVWPALLAQWLAPQRVLNLGLIDAGPQQYLHLYETFGSPRHPRMVLVGLSLANDFEDAELFDRWWQADGRENYRVWRAFESGQMSLAHPLDIFPTLLSRHSYLYHIVWPHKPRVTHFPCLDGVWLRLLLDRLLTASAKAQPDQHAFHLVLQALQRLEALAQQQGTEVLFVFQPSKEETYLPLRGEPIPDIKHALQEALTQQGMITLDLTPAFRHQAAIGERLFFAVDGYPNAQGHALIARSVLRQLTGQAQVYN
jgi:hypothetical protein